MPGFISIGQNKPTPDILSAAGTRSAGRKIVKPLFTLCYTLRFWILITILSIVLGVMAIVAGFFDSSGNTTHKIASLWSRLLCRWNNVEVEIIGLENVLKNQSQIFVSNHQGYFDIFTLTGFLPLQFRWVAKSSLFRIPFLGWAMKSAKYLPVVLGNRKKSYQAFIKIRKSIRQGNSVIIFPEGTRSADGTIGPFKKGGQLLATQSGVPVVPVTLIGSWNIMRKGSMTIYPGPVKIIFSHPMKLNSSSSEPGERSFEEIRKTICNNMAFYS